MFLVCRIGGVSVVRFGVDYTVSGYDRTQNNDTRPFSGQSPLQKRGNVQYNMGV